MADPTGPPPPTPPRHDAGPTVDRPAEPTPDLPAEPPVHELDDEPEGADG